MERTNSKKKLRILALHGYGQDADDFQGKIKTFTKKFANIAVFEFIDAPFTFTNVNGREGRSWIKNTPPPESDIDKFTCLKEYEGIEESLEKVTHSTQKKDKPRFR